MTAPKKIHLVITRIHASAVAIVNAEDMGVVALAALEDGTVRELLIRTEDPDVRLEVKRCVLKPAGEHPDDEPAADASLAMYGVSVFKAPYMTVQEMLVAVHDEVWTKGSREIVWNADHAPDPDGGIGRWALTVRCGPHHLFRFWKANDSALLGMPADHPDALDEPGLGPGVTLDADGTPENEDGLLAVALPQLRDGYVHEGREFTVVIRESRAATTDMKERLVRLVLNALGLPEGRGDYVQVRRVKPFGQNKAKINFGPN